MWISVIGSLGRHARAQPPPGLLVRHRVGGRVALLEARERAEHAARLADVGGVDVQVAVEVGAVAVQPLAHLVGQRAELHQVGVLVERDAVVERERLAGARPCRGSASKVRLGAHAATSSSRAVGEALAGDEAGAADQGRRLLAGERRVVGVGAQAQRALGDDGREQLVGAEAEAPSAPGAVPARRRRPGGAARAAAPGGRARRGAACRGRTARRRAPGSTPQTAKPQAVDRRAAAPAARRRPRRRRKGRRTSTRSPAAAAARGRRRRRAGRRSRSIPAAARGVEPAERAPGRPPRRRTRRRRAVRASRRSAGAAACARTSRGAPGRASRAAAAGGRARTDPASASDPGARARGRASAARAARCSSRSSLGVVGAPAGHQTCWAGRADRARARPPCRAAPRSSPASNRTTARPAARRPRRGSRPACSPGGSVESGVSRTTSTSLRRSFIITSAARPTRSSEIPCAMRASPPVEQGMTTMASHPADPEANGARKSRRP